MKTRSVPFAMVVALTAIWAGPSMAKDQACTDGVDCLCDRLASDSNVVFCEDYENPGYNDGGATWTEAYSRDAVNSCWDPATGVGGRILEGTADSACFNIVQEGSCDVAGETDCVFDGEQAIGNKMDVGRTHGIFGLGKFSRGVRTFGITSVVKFSSNYVRGPGPGFKYFEWNAGLQSLHGGQDACSGGENNLSSQVPGRKGDVCGADPGPTSIWDGKLFFYPNPLPAQHYQATLGSIWDDGYTMYYRPFKSSFEGGSGPRWPLGTWACLRSKWTGYGTASARVEQWFEGPNDSGESKVIDISGIDTSALSSEKGAALSHQAPNDYFNGPQIPAGHDCGYGMQPNADFTGCVPMNPALARAYRYEDSYVVREGDPVSCADIGFGPRSSASGGQTAQPPAAPVLLP